jgi:signal transduction histidine kinase
VAIYGFVAVYLGYLPSMTVEELPADVSPWLQGITALSSMLAGMLWKGVRVWVYPLVQGLLVASVLTLARPEGSSTAYLEGLGAVLFCAVMAGVAQAVVRGAEKQDLAAARARQQAGLESARRTREREQARIDAVVHDDIMSVLLTAASATPQDGVAEQARQALQSIDSLKQGTRAAADAVYTGAETVAVTLGGLLELSNSVPFGYEIEGSRPVPALVASALSEAATEALRNCLRHAGVGASVSVTMRVTDEAVTVDVSDNGQGFSPDAIPERRLGVRRSIIGRMGAVDGGEATITSAPGDGTLVSLIWTRP